LLGVVVALGAGVDGGEVVADGEGLGGVGAEFAGADGDELFHDGMAAAERSVE
jgi:hypothetical protein